MVCDLITGATGFVGKALVQRWMDLNKHKQLFILGRNMPNYLGKNLEADKRVKFIEFDFIAPPKSKFPEDIEIDNIYHCGAIASIKANWNDLFETNVKGTVNLLNWIGSSAKLNQVVFISSALACGYNTSFNGGYCRMDSQALYNPNTPYGKSKYEAELKVKALAENFGFRLVIIRPSYIFGPGMRLDSGFSSFIQMVRSGGMGVRLNYPGSVSYTYIDNFVSLVLQQSENKLPVEEFFFADAMPVSYRDLFGMIGGIVGKEIKTVFVPKIFYKFISDALIQIYKISFLKEKTPIYLLPLFKKNTGCINYEEINDNHKNCITVPLEEGLKKTFDYIKNYEKIL